jgi:hypothetical protein
MDFVLLATEYDDIDLIENESSLIIEVRGPFEKSRKIRKA